MRVGILFAGPSREREISFAGGRTVYDNLDKTLFEPVPIFIDSLKNFILLDWQYLYKGTIRDFYPPADSIPKSENGFQVYVESLSAVSDELINQVGRKISLSGLAGLIDIAFLALHGEYGEDGQIQQQLEELGIPYTGSGVEASAIGMNKALQKQRMKDGGWPVPKFFVASREAWKSNTNFKPHCEEVGFPLIVKPANQGSSIGASRADDFQNFEVALERAFFSCTISSSEWSQLADNQKITKVRDLTDIRSGIGLPAVINNQNIAHPEELLQALESALSLSASVEIESTSIESEVIVEEFIEGKEFSCIVIRNEPKDGSLGEPVALPPTEIRKGKEVFDYRSKYLAGLSRKITPIDLPAKQIEAIRKECEKLFDFFGFHVYARIDGFIKPDGTIYLNDPNTTSGMLPSSFFFHQAAEIGLNPSQFLTYIIRTSLLERISRPSHNGASKWSKGVSILLRDLDESIRSTQQTHSTATKVGVILGGYSSERHISVESGRNVYEKLSASTAYSPIPIFLKGNPEKYDLWQIPINMLLKDNADDISEKIEQNAKHQVVEAIKDKCASLTRKYASSDYSFSPRRLDTNQLSEEIDFAFLALHGRPGEDGALQQQLEAQGLPYNGSGPSSSQATIDKHRTNQILEENGFKVTPQTVVGVADYRTDPELVKNIEHDFGFPLIAKPVDDGCSSAVKRIDSEVELNAYMQTIFRESEEIGKEQTEILNLKPKEEFPIKNRALIEGLIEAGNAVHFLEVTGGMLVKPGEEPEFEVFEPSEALAGEAVLSLEEKFLAGEGQNVTPARFSADPRENAQISEQVKADLRRAAEVLHVEGYCRIDAFVRIYNDGKIETIIIEVNSLPGLTPATVIFHQAAINNYKPFDFIDRIIQLGFERSKIAAHQS